MAIHTGKFVAALRSKFNNDPRAVLRKLGLDEGLLKEQREPEREAENDEGNKALKALSVALQEKLREAHLNGGAISPKLRSELIGLCEEHTRANPASNLMSAPAADQEKEPLTDEGLEEAIRSYMESHEMSEREIEEAIARLRGARTAEAILDSTRLPKNAQQKGGYGGALGAMDSARSDRFAERHGALVGHIAVAEQNSRRPRRGAAVGPGFAARHPDAARVL